jgi:hypothetical protein
MVVLVAPIDIKNSGMTLYTILVDVSVKKLVSPVKKTLRSNPKNLLAIANPLRFKSGTHSLLFVP